MATRTEILLIDDVDGSSASETVTFALDGGTYEIDLNDANAQSLRDAVSPWIDKARRVGGKAKAASTSSKSSRSAERATYLSGLRAWAKENGRSVPERGRVPAETERDYDDWLAQQK